MLQLITHNSACNNMTHEFNEPKMVTTLNHEVKAYLRTQFYFHKFDLQGFKE